MDGIQRQVAVLTSQGLTAEETARRLRVSKRTVERYRARTDVKALAAELRVKGLTPEVVLETLLYSPNEQTRMRAAVELGKLRNASGYAPEGSHAPQITVVTLDSLPPIPAEPVAAEPPCADR